MNIFSWNRLTKLLKSREKRPQQTQDPWRLGGKHRYPFREWWYLMKTHWMTIYLDQVWDYVQNTWYQKCGGGLSREELGKRAQWDTNSLRTNVVRTTSPQNWQRRWTQRNIWVVLLRSLFSNLTTPICWGKLTHEVWLRILGVFIGSGYQIIQPNPIQLD